VIDGQHAVAIVAKRSSAGRGAGDCLVAEAIVRIGPDPTTAFVAKQSRDAAPADHSYVAEALVCRSGAWTMEAIARIAAAGRPRLGERDRQR
jgi:hypothetical protein